MWFAGGGSVLSSFGAPSSEAKRARPQFCSNFVSSPCVVSPKGPKARDFGSGRILGGVEKSMFLGHAEIYKSGGASGKSHLVLL